MNDLIDLIPLAVILCAGIFVQAAAGFGAGLLIVPTLMWFNYPIPEAQAALLVATIPQNMQSVWLLRDAIDPKQLVVPATVRLLFLPLGVLTLLHLESLSTVTIRQIVGGLVLVVTIAFIVVRPTPRERLHPIWGAIAFPLSGYLQGLVGVGGPPLVFWLQGHDWDTRRTRGFLFAMFLISIFPALAILYWTFGSRILKPMLVTATMVPLLLLATSGGLRFGTALGRERLRRATLGLLILIGITGLAAPLLQP